MRRWEPGDVIVLAYLGVVGLLVGLVILLGVMDCA